MADTGVVWVTPPQNLQRAIQLYGRRVIVAMRAIAAYLAQQMMEDARRSAPWRDRTGNARSGLFTEVDMQGAAGDIIEIYLSHGHTIEYGVFLELARGGKYAIILPTIEKHLPRLRQMLDELFR